RLMLVRIERLVHGMDAPDAMPLEHVEQLPLGQGDPFQEALEGGVLLGGASGNGADGALEVVADVDDVPLQLRDRLFGCVLLLALRPLADVLHFRMGPEQPVLEVGCLCLQCDDYVVGRAPSRFTALVGWCAGIGAGGRGARTGGALRLRRLVVRCIAHARCPAIFVAARRSSDMRLAAARHRPWLGGYHAVAAKNQVSRRPTSLAV